MCVCVCLWFQASHADVFFGASCRSDSTISDGSTDPVPLAPSSTCLDPAPPLSSNSSSSSDASVPTCGFVNSCYFVSLSLSHKRPVSQLQTRTSNYNRISHITEVAIFTVSVKTKKKTAQKTRNPPPYLHEWVVTAWFSPTVWDAFTYKTEMRRLIYLFHLFIILMCSLSLFVMAIKMKNGSGNWC